MARPPEDKRPDRTDSELLDRAREGDNDAFHELIERHGERLFRLARSLVGSAEDADDVVQETLLGAFEYMHGFEGRSTVKTWLTRILMRQAARHHRRRGRSREEHGLHPGLAGAWSEGTVSESANRRRDVKAALDRLSYDHRQVVVLREFEGMTYAEIAEAVGVPRGTVESRLYRARQELKEMLKDYLP